MKTQRGSKKRALIHLSPFFTETPIFFVSAIAGHFPFFSTIRLTEYREIFRKFFWKHFSKNICCTFQFLRISVKEISCLNLEGGLFVTFDHVELMIFLFVCEKISFRLCASFRNFYLVEGYSLAFIAEFGVRKVFLRAETCFAMEKFYQKKFALVDFL